MDKSSPQQSEYHFPPFDEDVPAQHRSIAISKLRLQSLRHLPGATPRLGERKKLPLNSSEMIEQLLCMEGGEEAGSVQGKFSSPTTIAESRNQTGLSEREVQ